MRGRLDHVWRLVATALAFTLFGLGGLLLRGLLFPLLSLLVVERERRATIARLSIHHCFRWFIGFMRCTGILAYRLEGIERLRRPGLLILANHPTLIDVVFLISLVPDATCIVKSALARNSFTRGPVKAANYICNGSGPGVVEECIASLRAGHSLVIFPEGTRTPVSGEFVMQRGAANIAARGGCNITPVIISCVPRSLTKDLPWWRIPPRRMLFTIKVCDDIEVAPFLAAAANEPALAVRRLSTHLQHHFTSENELHAGARG